MMMGANFGKSYPVRGIFRRKLEVEDAAALRLGFNLRARSSSQMNECEARDCGAP
jgi:hypothetical protein